MNVLNEGWEAASQSRGWEGRTLSWDHGLNKVTKCLVPSGNYRELSQTRPRLQGGGHRDRGGGEVMRISGLPLSSLESLNESVDISSLSFFILRWG